jgi:exodeoxyribonuclease VII large subunit
LKILERGYAVAFDPAGKLLTDASQISAGDQLKVRLARGELDAEVLKIRK